MSTYPRTASFLTLLWALAALWPAPARAADVDAATCSNADVQAAINTAVNGDRVLVPAGSCTWTATVTIPNTKGITLEGAGIDQTIIDGTPSDAVDVTLGTTTAVTRITGFTWAVTGTRAIDLGPASLAAEASEFRIDNNKFTAKSIRITCRCYGVIDHNTFTAATPFSAVFVFERPFDSNGDGGAASWVRARSSGTRDMVYVEDNTFDFDSPTAGSSCVDGRSGGRVVIRYNTIKNISCTAHDAEITNERGMREWEFHNNTHIITESFNAALLQHRGGTGVIHSNVFKRLNGATYTQAGVPVIVTVVRGTGGEPGRDPWEDACNAPNGTRKFCFGGPPSRNSGAAGYCTTDADCTGEFSGPCVAIDGSGMDNYPCRDQLGAGICDAETGVHTMEPVYLWDNLECASAGSDCTATEPYSGVSIHEGTAAQIQDGRDFFSSTQSPTWAEFTYPHPLVSGVGDRRGIHRSIERPGFPGGQQIFHEEPSDVGLSHP